MHKFCVLLTSVFVLEVSLAEWDDSSFEWQSPDLSSATTEEQESNMSDYVQSHWYNGNCCVGVFDMLHVRVVDIKKPVEAHVHTQRDIDQVRVALLQPLVQAGQTGDQLGDIQQLLVLLQTVLVKHLACHRHAQQVHCTNKERGGWLVCRS